MTKKLYEYLLSYASVPYFKILKRWIYHGEIKDPSNEFMVEKKNIRKENLHEEFNDVNNHFYILFRLFIHINIILNFEFKIINLYILFIFSIFIIVYLNIYNF